MGDMRMHKALITNWVKIVLMIIDVHLVITRVKQSLDYPMTVTCRFALGVKRESRTFGDVFKSFPGPRLCIELSLRHVDSITAVTKPKGQISLHGCVRGGEHGKNDELTQHPRQQVATPKNELFQ